MKVNLYKLYFQLFHFSTLKLNTKYHKRKLKNFISSYFSISPIKINKGLSKLVRRVDKHPGKSIILGHIECNSLCLRYNLASDY